MRMTYTEMTFPFTYYVTSGGFIISQNWRACLILKKESGNDSLQSYDYYMSHVYKNIIQCLVHNKWSVKHTG